MLCCAVCRIGHLCSLCSAVWSSRLQLGFGDFNLHLPVHVGTEAVVVRGLVLKGVKSTARILVNIFHNSYSILISSTQQYDKIVYSFDVTKFDTYIQTLTPPSKHTHTPYINIAHTAITSACILSIIWKQK